MTRAHVLSTWLIGSTLVLMGCGDSGTETTTGSTSSSSSGAGGTGGMMSTGGAGGMMGTGGAGGMGTGGAGGMGTGGAGGMGTGGAGGMMGTGGQGGSMCMPATEICDGIDNDCDGMVDEGNPDGGAMCNTGLSGQCAMGTQTCVNGSLSCTPNTPPVAELCGNAIDDDCDGVVDEGLEPTGWETRITNTTTQSSVLGLVWTGSEYGVLYQEYLGASPRPVIHFQRVDAMGALIGSPVAVSSLTATTHHGRIAWNGSEYAVAYWTYETWPDDATRFQRISSTGTLIGAPVDIDPNPSSQPDIVWNGNDWAVTWMSRVTSQIMFQRISTNGSLIGSAAPLGMGHTIGEIAWTGTQYGVGWDRYDYNTGKNTGYFTRVGTSGAEIGSEITTTPATMPALGCCGTAYLFDMAWNGSSFGILRRGLNDRLTFIPVSSSGVLGTSSMVIDEQAMYPDMLWNGSEYLATFTWISTTPKLSFARLSPTGAFRGRHVLNWTTHPKIGFARIAWDGTNLVAAWHDERYGNQEVSLARFAPACQ